MSAFFASVFLLALGVCVLLNLVTLPGNWAMAALVLAWALLVPQSGLDTLFFVLFIGLAVAGEAVEFGAQLWGAKKYGSSKVSTIAGILGTIAGAILGAPFLFGLGAVFGALLGAWAGCLLAELLLRRQPWPLALRAAQGAFVGRFLGMVIKFGLGMAMLALTASRIWPESL
ncbi:DUF456 domain-containing protein [Mailhella massiliensis]|uniref:DUF456 domain-containing protein n=1 Tax=Mailhella massiliensis TaxID=1903261 RepID=A0A921AYS7_9BACT|nr:DUF456 domain-containing protein [Mailhella massiliensis]HJD98278.1 DUF456 domain-containing protein [Mailhella massiliensis]